MDVGTWDRIEVKLKGEDATMNLAAVLLTVIVFPIAFLLCVVLLHVRLVSKLPSATSQTTRGPRGILGIARELLWLARERLHKQSYATHVLVTSSAFFICAYQVSLAEWNESCRTGNRDSCHYNYRCYHALVLDLPFNSFMSHIPYVALGMFALVVVLVADWKMSSVYGDGAPDLQIFYALGVAECMEAVGSVCYHICPQRFYFQFDVAVIFVMCLLSMLALADADGSDVTKQPPVAMFYVVIVPMWFISLIGTWFDHDNDLEELAADRRITLTYVLFTVIVVLWGAYIVRSAWVLFPKRHGRTSSKCLTAFRLFIFSSLLLIMIVPWVRVKVGGTGKALMIILIVASLTVITRQQYHIAWPILRKSNNYAFAVKLVFFALFATMCTAAVVCFSRTPYKSGGKAWFSHDRNTECGYLGMFDFHDVWHIHSAVAFTLWILGLLSLRVEVSCSSDTTNRRTCGPCGTELSRGSALTSDPRTTMIEAQTFHSFTVN